MSEQDDSPDRDESEDQDRDDSEDRGEERERAFDLNDPELEPGLTARLDHVTEEEKKSGPMGMMAGAGPDPDDVARSGVEGQEDREGQHERATDSDQAEDGSDEGNDSDEGEGRGEDEPS
jgi:hypothetical protein